MALGVGLLGAAVACGGTGYEDVAPSQSCERQSATALPTSWAGAYHLTLVAETGPHAGRRGEGVLRLTAHAPDDQVFRRPGAAPDSSVRLPAFGSTDVALDGVGALRLGSTMADDPHRPGVQVIEEDRAGGRVVTLRLGAMANQRGLTRFDGGFTALRVRWAEGRAFGGDWSSGVRGTDASGYFCVLPVGD